MYLETHWFCSQINTGFSPCSGQFLYFLHRLRNRSLITYIRKYIRVHEQLALQMNENVGKCEDVLRLHEQRAIDRWTQKNFDDMLRWYVDKEKLSAYKCKKSPCNPPQLLHTKCSQQAQCQKQDIWYPGFRIKSYK